MNIKIRSTNFEITPAIEDYIYKKISHLEKFFSGNNEIYEIEIGKTTSHHKSGDIFKAEINISAPKGVQYYATAEEYDLYAAIDVVRDEIERKIVSGKKKRFVLFRKGALKIKNLIKRINWKKNDTGEL